MSDTRDLLIEIGTEELPPKALRRLSLAFADEMAKGLDSASCSRKKSTSMPHHGDWHCCSRHCRLRRATGKQLAVVRQLPLLLMMKAVRLRLPSASQNPAALKSRNWTSWKPKKAAGFLSGPLRKVSQPPRLIPDLVSQALAALPIPKRMRWGDRDDEFVRPVHWVVLLFGDEVIDATILGVKAGRSTHGHRFPSS